jgi:hypothetical protein
MTRPDESADADGMLSSQSGSQWNLDPMPRHDSDPLID